jgi:hypothetical protein
MKMHVHFQGYGRPLFVLRFSQRTGYKDSTARKPSFLAVLSFWGALAA